MIGRITAVFTRLTCILQLGLLAAAVALPADTNASTVSRVIDQLEAVHSFSEVTISPDGHWVTWSEPAPGGVDGTAIFLADRTQPSVKPLRITAVSDPKSYVTEEGLAWSRDSRRVAFLSYASDPKQAQVYALTVASTIQAKKLTSLDGYVTDLRWTSDGQNIGFLYAGGGGGGGPLQAASAETGVIGAAIHNQQLATVPSTGGPLRAISPSELNV